MIEYKTGESPSSSFQRKSHKVNQYGDVQDMPAPFGPSRPNAPWPSICAPKPSSAFFFLNFLVQFSIFSIVILLYQPFGVIL